MIQLPTGTGKTGIMAVTSNIFDGNVLIIAPNAVIPEQLFDEISSGFWNKIGHPSVSCKKVMIIESGKLVNSINFSVPQVFIITIQTLLYLFENDRSSFEFFKTNISLILFDEGHREPAKKWSIASRELSCKTILFTATPLRNDKVLFDIDTEYRYAYSYQDAFSAEYICPVAFFPISNYHEMDIHEKALFIKGLYKRENKKIIIRMKNKDQISALCDELNKDRKNFAIAFHSDFKSDSYRTCKGSDIRSLHQNYKVFIHSDMLIEGIDINSLKSLVLFDRFDNTKSFVQQIGRIIRRDDSHEVATVYIPELAFEDLSEQWSLFLDHDNGNEIIEYIDNRFSHKFSFDSEFHKQVLIPKKANVYKSNNSLFEEVHASILKKIQSRVDLKSLQIWEHPTHNFWIMCYEKKSPSKFLTRSVYYDKTLELTVLFERKLLSDYHLFYYDSSGYTLPDGLNSIVEIEPDSICKLFPSKVDLIQAKYTNTNPINIGSSSRQITGLHIDKTSPDLTEKLSLCNYAQGYIDDSLNGKFKRYLNPTNARITDSSSCSCEGYIEWCKGISNTINSTLISNSFFSRYSKIVKKPQNNATSIMLELSVRILNNNDGSEFELESQHLELNKNEFEICIDNCNFKGSVVFSSSNDRPELQLNNVDNYIVIDEDRKPLNEFLKFQHFRIYYAKDQIMYYNRHYFKPNIQTHFSNAADYSLWSNILIMKGLDDCIDEKLGTKAKGSTWPPKSIFSVVVDLLKADSDIDFLVCDDQQTEISDFIALSTSKNTSYFIHCKFKIKGLSASAFQDVCGQASKNIHYIMTTDFDSLDYFGTHAARWSKKWNYTDWSIDRCVKGNVDDFVESLKKIVTSPTSKKEIWLVQSGLSKSDLKRELEKVPSTKKKNTSKTQQTEELPQLIWLLQSTQDYAKQVNAEVKVYCQE